MAQWQPKRTLQERNTRAIRSMQNGTLDGRILGSPVRFDPFASDDFDDEIDEEGGIEEESITLLPFTDTFTPGNSDNLTFTLTFFPWTQPEMPTITRNKASLHLYWNGVFQRDLTYSLNGRVLTVFNDSLAIRPGDSISVKYFYEEGADEDSNTTIYRMECWLDRVSIKNTSDYSLWMDRFLGATISAPPLGQNGGNITIAGTRFQSMEFLGNWYSRWRMPKNMTIPMDDTVESVTWLVDYDQGASISLYDGPISGIFYKQGTDIGEIVGGQGSCSGVFSLCREDVPPYQECTVSHIQAGISCTLCWQMAWGEVPDVLNAQPGHAGSPSAGPTSGTVFAEGEAARSLVKLANIRYGDGEHRSFSVRREMPERGDREKICSTENTIFSPYDFYRATYDVRIGVTCVVVRKD